APPEGGVSRWDHRLADIGSRHSSAVLSIVSPDGFPFAARVRVALDPARRWIEIDQVPQGIPFASGRACLTAHRHDERFRWQENFQVRGDLVAREGSWALVPHRLIGGFEMPRSRVAFARANAAKARRYHKVAKRELARRG